MSQILNPVTTMDDLGGGHYRQYVHQRPVAYQRSGVWHAITNQLGSSGDAEFPLGVDEALQFGVNPKIAGVSPIMRFGAGGCYTTIAPIGANNGNGEVQNSSVLFTEAWNNADLRLTIMGHRLRKDIILRSGHPTQFQFRLASQEGFDPETLSWDGSFFVRQPFLTQGGMLSIPLAWDVTLSGGIYTLGVTLPPGDWAGWVLDPTLDLQPDSTTGLDTFMNQDYPANQYSNWDHMWSGSQQYGEGPLRALLKFDVSSIPSDHTCDSGDLILYHLLEYASVTRIHRVYRMLRGWTEVATWNTFDGSNAWGTAGASNTTSDREATDIGSLSLSDTEANGYKTWSLTASAVQDWWDGGLTNNGLILVADDESNDAHKWPSCEHSTSAYRPNLVIVHSAPGGETFYGSAVLSGSGSLAAAGYRRVWAGATLAGAGGLAAEGSAVRFAAAALSATGALSGTALRRRFSTAALSATGALTGVAMRRRFSTAALAGTGALTGSGGKLLYGSAVLAGAGTLEAQAQRISYAAAVLGGLGQLLAAAHLIAHGRATLTGVGSLSAALTELIDSADITGVVSLAGTWSTSVTLDGEWDQTVSLEGSLP